MVIHLEFFLSRIKLPMILKRSMKHQGLELFKAHIIDHPGLTVACFFSKVIICALCIEMGKSLNGKPLHQITKLAEVKLLCLIVLN